MSSESRFVPLLLIGAALAMRLLLYTPLFTPDGERYTSQARELLAHHGYVTHGELDVSLAPGYPVFLAVLLAVDGLTLVRVVQVLLSTAATVLLWAALRLRGSRRALAVALVLALHPWIAVASGAILSETFALFVCSLLVYFMSRIETNHGNALTFFEFGALSVALLMITPATMFLAFALFIYVAWRHRRRILWLTVGALVIMVPWQIHSWEARHRITPTVFVVEFRQDISVWARTWILRERELQVFWHPHDLAAVPLRAFRSAAERGALISEARTADGEAFGSALRHRGEEIEATEPMRVDLIYPAARAALLWLDMPQLGHVQMEYVMQIHPDRDLRRTVLRLGKTFLSTFGFLIYAGVPLVFLVLAVRRRAIAPMLIIVTVAIYTLISAYYGVNEARRNLPFYPALLFVVFYERQARGAT